MRLDSLGGRILKRVKEDKKKAYASDFVTYQRVNKKIRHVIKNKKPYIRKDEVKSILLESFFEVNRSEICVRIGLEYILI